MPLAGRRVQATPAWAYLGGVVIGASEIARAFFAFGHEA